MNDKSDSMTFTTPPEVLVDAMIGNPPLAAMPPDGDAKGKTGGEPCTISRPEAVMRLMALMKKRSMTVADVNALKMAVTAIVKRHADNQRNWARRRAADAAKEA